MDQGYHSPHEDEDPEQRARQRDKFKREHDDDRDRSPIRRRSPSPRERGSPRRKSRSRSRSPRERNPAPPGRGRKDSPPFKRRKREDEWDDRSPEPHRSPRRGRGYDDYDDAHEQYPRRGGYHPPRSAGRNTPRTPIGGLFDGPMLTYKQFLDHLQDDRISPSDADKRYEDYQLEFKKRQAKTFFNEHKNDEWFKEKYEPSYLEQKHTEKIAKAKEQVLLLTQSMQTFDFNLSATIEDINKNLAAKHEEHKDEENEEDSNHSEISTTESDTSSSTTSTTSTSSSNSGTVIFIKVIPSYISKNSVYELFKSTTGFQRLLLSEPQRFKNFNRLGWCHYDSPENCANALKELAGHAKIGEFGLQLAVNKTPSESLRIPKITPPVAAEDSRITIDKEQSKLLCMQLDKEKGIDNNPFYDLTDKKEYEMLDRYVVYLRKVHCYCYYCGEEYEDEDELSKKCDKHLRGRKKEDTISEISTDPWAVSLDTKIKARLNNPDDPDTYTGKRLIEHKTIVKVEEDKFRCSLCNKLFMADSFVKKHQTLKHADKIEEVKKKAIEKQYFMNYFSDPKRIMPISNTPGRNMGRGRGWNNSPGPVNNPQFFTPNRGGGGGNRRKSTPRQSPQNYREPPPGMSLDPRALKEYVDLDAPSEEAVQIDYRIGDVRKKQKSKQ